MTDTTKRNLELERIAELGRQKARERLKRKPPTVEQLRLLRQLLNTKAND